MTRYTKEGAAEVRRATEEQVRRLAEAVKEGEAMTSEPQVLHEWMDRGERYCLMIYDGYLTTGWWWAEHRVGGITIQGRWVPNHKGVVPPLVLVELWRLADLLRPRYPSHGELPADGQEVVAYAIVDGFVRTLEYAARYEATWRREILCWYPAPLRPALPSPEGAEGETEKEAT